MNINKSYITLVIAFFGLLFTNAVTAQDVKIGYVNPQAILANMPEMKAVQQRLQNFAAKKQQELSLKEQDFQNQVSEYEQKAGVISADAKRKEEERLGQLQVDLVNAQKQADSDFQQKKNELIGPLLTQISNAIDKVAKAKGLTYVLNTTTSTGDMIILYVSEEFQAKSDITESVMQELGMYN